MKIIISPAKKMLEDTDTFTGDNLPVFLEDTESKLRNTHKQHLFHNFYRLLISLALVQKIL